MTNEQIIEVGKALLPYLRNDLDPADLGRAAHDATAALWRTVRLTCPETEMVRDAIAQLRCGGSLNRTRADLIERLLTDQQSALNRAPEYNGGDVPPI